MKVLLINGSPHLKGCTYTALNEVAKALNEDGVETEIVNVSKTNSGCMGCGYCFKEGKCVNNSDCVNEIIARLNEFDGFVFGSPVHYASASGAITSFMDRLFYAGSKDLKYKLGATVASARRGGTTATLDQLTKHLTISNMPVVSSSYWNMVHGSNAEEVMRDEEGMQTMRNLGHNMAWLLKCIELGKENGVPNPTPETGSRTNFIR
ncbi:MAG: flavodoxin family protein [Clostridia bacterium]|nr:flavodoxin family protein [Clostridia bacterium]